MDRDGRYFYDLLKYLRWQAAGASVLCLHGRTKAWTQAVARFRDVSRSLAGDEGPVYWPTQLGQGLSSACRACFRLQGCMRATIGRMEGRLLRTMLSVLTSDLETGTKA